jgi:hypothetical protein
MGPCEHPPSRLKNQHKGKSPRPRCRARRPRSRTCLLKGCGRKFRPRHPLERYCSKHCRDQARKWRQWKARHEYRQSPHGKQVRRAQSRRYRQRRKNKGVKKRRSKVREGHHKKSFFMLLQPPRVLRNVPPQAPLTPATVLLQGMPAGSRACSGAGAPLDGAWSRA